MTPPASGPSPTDGVREGQVITQAHADAFLGDDAAHTLTVLNLLTGGVATAGFQLTPGLRPRGPNRLAADVEASEWVNIQPAGSRTPRPRPEKWSTGLAS